MKASLLTEDIQQDKKDDFSANQLTQAADMLFESHLKFSSNTIEPHNDSTSRRLFFASSLIAAASVLGATDAANAATLEKWEATPVNKRTGVTVFDVEKDGYNVRFVTYLSRFLLCFDKACQKWWYERARIIPITASEEEVNKFRLNQFGAFSASVEVGLQEYRAKDDGPRRLLLSLLERYCPSTEALRKSREKDGLSPLSEKEEARMEREIKEARRQIALLFALMEKNQPVDEISKLLAAIDNGSISSVRILDPGSGYAPGYGPPEVRFPPPDAGESFQTATGRAILSPNGKILRIDVVNRGAGYAKPPEVTVSPPASLRFESGEEGEIAEAKAFLFRGGPNKGRIERIQLLNPGSGYTEKEIIRIRIAPPEASVQNGGVTATATAVLEYEVSDIIILNNGTGYGCEKPIEVYVEPPPLTARVNMNDPLMARVISPDQPLPATSIPTKEMRAKMPNPSDPNSVESIINFAARRGSGSSGCFGRGCYDDPVQVIAFPVAEKDVFNAFQSEDDFVQAKQKILKSGSAIPNPSAAEIYKPRTIRSADSSLEDILPSFGTNSRSTSTQILQLLPGGVGLVFDTDLNRYTLAVDPEYSDTGKSFVKDTSVIFEPDFGPRGRSPIERDMQLGAGSFLRFVVSGAICCGGVHLALTPIDVVKTKVQTDPESYPDVIEAFKRVLADSGPTGFFTGWVPTLLGFLTWGGISYSLTEYTRRFLFELAGPASAGLEVPIILTAASVGAFLGSFVISPFEAVRIRSVFQKDYAPNILAVYNRMVAEEGFFSLFSAVPVVLAKEIPFAAAKFTVFDLSTTYLYNVFPAAKEELNLSLGISLVGGILGGIVAAIVSNPADVTISQMKKTKSNMSPIAAGQLVLERDGPAGFFRGLPLRLVFYMLLVSLQFLIYDAVRIALGVGADDLKQYLDVLGNALSETGGPV
ncbi:hypothetical protein FisN_14Lh315 [Fistulifera solaris]|uniref:Solute carrier family 25 (Mitochondrial phosphate transporter), member 23/24/25/41 n=1 Tax=Fistulifera solaris TaxID=1519565 RepID=A0A1Z5JI45_FISSO|nr:hypothetical protein FisN_14Lh315 [Fistulifera solaris]|eukprot:GAX13669.1 hypothetical protein FisN_14Lh315 [Fistulifera solaris]